MGFFSLRGYEVESVPCLSKQSLVSLGWWLCHSSLSVCLHEPFFSVSQLPLLSLVRAPLIGFRAHPKPRMISQDSRLHLRRPCVQIRAHSQLWWAFVWGPSVPVGRVACCVSLESSREPPVALSSSAPRPAQAQRPRAVPLTRDHPTPHRTGIPGSTRKERQPASPEASPSLWPHRQPP